jgi:hypothetical protein
MFHNINFYKIVLILFVLLSNNINAKEVYTGEKTVDIPECKQEHYTKDINTSKYIEYLYNKLDLTNAGTILGQEIKYSTKKYLKEFFPDLSFSESSKTIIKNKENKELWVEDDGAIIIFDIIKLEDNIMTVQMTNKAKGGTYMTVSVLEIDMSDDSVRDLGLCYAR